MSAQKIAFVLPAKRADKSPEKLFYSLLRTAGLDKNDYLITTVFPMELDDDEVGSLCADTKTARNMGWDTLPPIGGCGYLRPKYHCHVVDLANRIADYKPNTIVPLGSTALWAFTGNASVAQNRGAVQQSADPISGYKLLPTMDPKQVMQQWKWYSIVVGDILKAVKEAERGPSVFYPERHLLLEPTIDEIEEYTTECLQDAVILSADIETGWGQITCIGFAPTTQSAICIPFVDIRKPNKSYWADAKDEVRAWKCAKRLLESDIPKLGQNYAAYDAFWLLAKKGIKTMNLLHDTRLLHHALYPELPKDLAFLGASYTQQGPWKTWGYSAKTKRDD